MMNEYVLINVRVHYNIVFGIYFIILWVTRVSTCLRAFYVYKDEVEISMWLRWKFPKKREKEIVLENVVLFQRNNNT